MVTKCPSTYCVLVFLFGFEKGFISQILKYKIFQYFGKLSYSIYLVHGLVILLVLSLLMVMQKILEIELTQTLDGVRFMNFGSDFYNNITLFIIIGLTIFISNYTYKYIEQKGLEMGKNLKKRQ